MQYIEDILKKRGEEAVKKIQANVPVATGKTRDSVRFSVDGNTLVIVGGRPFFPAVETGSKPSSKNPSPEYVASLKEWMEMRGISGSPYGMAKGILKRGSSLWRAGGRADVYSNVVSQTIDLINKDLVAMSKETGKEIFAKYR